MGIQIDQQQLPSPTWPSLERIGLIVHSDTTGPGAAPPISQSFLETLSRRAEEFMTQRCRVSSVVPMAFPSSSQQAQNSARTHVAWSGTWDFSYPSSCDIFKSRTFWTRDIG